MKSLLTPLTLSFFLLASNSFAQFSYQDVNNQSLHKDIRDIAADNGGNIIISGGLNTTLTFGNYTVTNNYPRVGYPGDGDYAATSFIAKETPDGNGGYNFVWAKSIVLATHNKWDYWAIIQDITTDAGGNIYITGQFWGDIRFDAISLSYTQKIGWAIFTAKLSPSGNFLWAKMESDLISMWGYGIAVDATSNVYITGKDESKKITVNHIDKYQSNVYVAKYNPGGSKVWEKKFTSNQASGEYYHSGYSVKTNGSAIYIGGNIKGNINFGNGFVFNPSPGINNSFLLKLDVNGNTQWAKSVTGAENVAENVLLDNGYIFLSGGNSTLTPPALVFSSEVNLGLYAGNGRYLVKYSADGTPQWAINTNVSSPEITKNPSGGIVFPGYGYPGFAIREFSVIDGALLSSTNSVTYDPPSGNNNLIWGITSTTDGYIFSVNMNGYFDFGGITIPSSQPANNSYTSYKDMILVKYTGNPPPAVDPSSLIARSSQTNEITLYPNPATEQIILRNSLNKILGTVMIYDVSGKPVYQESVDNSQVTIDVQLLVAGIYFLRSEQSQAAIRFLKQ